MDLIEENQSTSERRELIGSGMLPENLIEVVIAPSAEALDFYSEDIDNLIEQMKFEYTLDSYVEDSRLLSIRLHFENALYISS